MEKTRVQLGEGVYLTYLPAVKFKTNYLSAQFIAPLRRETAALNALLPPVLRRGTAALPDLARMEAHLDMLYGASVSASVRKMGEAQTFGFLGSIIDDACALDGKPLLEPLAALLGDLVCHPALEDGGLVPAYVEGERAIQIDAIRSVINEKRAYANKRLLEEMCDEEPFGLSHIGEGDTASAITPSILTSHYRRQLAKSPLELFYCGKGELPRVQDALAAAFADLPREDVAPIGPITRRPARSTPKIVTEALDVTQGKLGLGFRISVEDDAANMLLNAMFGGTSNAKLFMNVREKLSLCYYASSRLHRYKGLLTVASGIEFANVRTACEEILAQLEAMRTGDWEPWELESAKSGYRNALLSAGDSARQMEDFYLGQLVAGQDDTPEGLLAKIEAVTPERIQAAAQSAVLDTVYFLKGKEEA